MEEMTESETSACSAAAGYNINSTASQLTAEAVTCSVKIALETG